jgi:hypothetical protein
MSVGIATGYGLEVKGSVPGRGKIFSSPQSPDRFWGPLSLLSIGYRVLLPRRYSGRAVKLTIRLPPHNAEVKNGGATSALPPTSSWCGA